MSTLKEISIELNKLPVARQKHKNFFLRAPIILAGIWLLLTLSLTAWWAYFAYTQIHRLTVLDHASSQELVKFQKMLLYEGTTLFLLLIIGSATFIYQALNKYKQSKQLEEFYLTLSHDIKTPLAGIQLQADLLNEISTDPKIKSKVQKIFESIGRLTVQLENSLFFSALSRKREEAFLIEECDIKEIINSVALMFPNLVLKFSKDIEENKINIKADKRALKSILQNIFQNAIQHGKTNEILIEKEDSKTKNNATLFVFTSTGDNFKGDSKNLGSLFTRHYNESGSGVGLYLIKKLSLAMNGNAEFEVSERDFKVKLFLNLA